MRARRDDADLGRRDDVAVVVEGHDRLDDDLGLAGRGGVAERAPPDVARREAPRRRRGHARLADYVAAPDAAFAGALSVEDARRLMGKLKAVAVECLRAGGGAGAEVSNVGLRDVRWETGLAAPPRLD